MQRPFKTGGIGVRFQKKTHGFGGRIAVIGDKTGFSFRGRFLRQLRCPRGPFQHIGVKARPLLRDLAFQGLDRGGASGRGRFGHAAFSFRQTKGAIGK